MLVVTPYRELSCCWVSAFYILARLLDQITLPSLKLVSTLPYARDHLLDLLSREYRRVRTPTTCHYITRYTGEMPHIPPSLPSQTGSSQKTWLLMVILMPSVKGTRRYPYPESKLKPLFRLGQECQPFEWDPPVAGLFEPKNIVIISNGRYVDHMLRLRSV